MLLEVMDKETSIQGFWIGATVLGAIGFVARGGVAGRQMNGS
jgi:hypothetical protein